MMKKIFFVFLISLLIVNFVNAQKDSLPGFVKGSLTIKNQAAPFYSILLYDTDNLFIKGAITDSLGYFELYDLKLIKYDLTARSVSLEEKIIARFQISQDSTSINLGVINIADNEGQFLEEVIVTAKAPTLKRTNEKIVLTIANSILATGNNVSDMLNYIPSVRVNPKGEVSVNRQGGVSIYIDGKSFQRVQEASEVLANIDPNSIEKIEVYSNPPARFDAEGSSIINIITVKKKKESNISGTYGHSLYQYNGEIGKPYQERLGTNLYYNFGKLQTYGQLSFGESLGAQFSRNEINYLDTSTSVLEEGNFESLSRSLRYGAGVQYEISNKEQISVDLKGLKSLGDELPTTTMNNQNLFLNNIIIPDSTGFSSNQLLRGYQNNSSGIGYWYENEDKGIQRDVQLIYSTKKLNNSRTINSTVLSPQLSQVNRDNAYESIVGLFNNSEPLSKSLNTKYGVKLTSLSFNEDLLQNSDFFSFDYSEIILSAYAEFSGSIENIDWQIGMRFENTKWEGNTANVSSKLEDNYSNFFPSLSFSVPIDSLGSNIGITYSRRISRPSVSELNPTPRINNQFSTQSGNGLELLPQLYDNMELNFSSGNFFWSSWYRRTGNRRAYIPLTIDGLNVDYEILSVKKALSIGTQLSYVANIGFWNPNLDISVFQDSQSLIDESTIGSTGYSIFFNNNFKLSEVLTASLTYLYDSKLVSGYNETSFFSSANTALRWSPKSKKFILGLRINDIFNTGNFSFSSNYPQLTSKNSVLNGSREIVLTATYRFKMGNDFKAKESKSDNEEFRVK